MITEYPTASAKSFPQGIDIDEDQRALDAYNAALAALHAQSPPPRPWPEQGPVTRR